MADYSSIIDEFRHTAGRLALKHKEEKAKRLKKKPPEAEKVEEQEEPADEDLDETAAEDEQEEEGEQEEQQEDLTHVIRRATRHARVVAHAGHGEKRPPGPPEIRPTARDAAHKIGMPPATAKAPMLKPRVVGSKR